MVIISGAKATGAGISQAAGEHEWMKWKHHTVDRWKTAPSLFHHLSQHGRESRWQDWVQLRQHTKPKPLCYLNVRFFSNVLFIFDQKRIRINKACWVESWIIRLFFLFNPLILPSCQNQLLTKHISPGEREPVALCGKRCQRTQTKIKTAEVWRSRFSFAKWHFVLFTPLFLYVFVFSNL